MGLGPRAEEAEVGDEEAEGGASGWGWHEPAGEGQAEEEDLAGQVMLFQRLLQILRVKRFFRKR